jgi:hypothetical protein
MIFTKLITAQKHYMQISDTEFHPNRPRNTKNGYKQIYDIKLNKTITIQTVMKLTLLYNFL